MSSGLRILLLEDDPVDAELTRIRLQGEDPAWTASWVDGREPFEAALADEAFDVVLADYNLPGYSGLDALAYVRARRPELPFVFVSGSIGEERAIECLQLGARDYVLKDHPSRLGPVIRRAVQESRESLERQLALSALEVAQARQRSLFEAACAAGVVPWTQEEGELLLGDSASPLLGLPAHRLPRSLAAVEELVHPEDLELFRNAFRHFRPGERSTFECRMLGPRHEWFWARWTCLRGQGGRGILQDVSEQHRLQEQLVRAQKIESLGEMAGRVAHDFNNILQGILGQTELVLSGPLTAEARISLEAVLRAADRGADLIHQLRTFSRNEPLHRAPLDPAGLLQEVRSLLAPTLGRDTDLEVRPSGVAPLVLADASQLHQVLVNLVVNARDAMASKGGRISLGWGLAHLDEPAAQYQGHFPGDYLYLEVEDQGPGIPTHLLGRIFEPYFTTKGEKGTGLGLAVASGVAQAHGGWMEVQNRPGRGARFRLHLPLGGPPHEAGHPAAGAPVRRPLPSPSTADWKGGLSHGA